uniref:histidine kinase n=1 Tax=candidate division WOR-3 bacterium TaxID=2052148 RepID=A0A7C4CCG6_UNCW3
MLSGSRTYLNSHNRWPSRRLLQLYSIAGLLALAGVWFLFSQFMLLRLSRLWTEYATTLSRELENDTQLRSRIYEKFMSRAGEPSDGGSAELDIIFDEVIRKIDFPVVITDNAGRPVAFCNLGECDTSAAGLMAVAAELDTEHAPIPVMVRDGDSLRHLSTIHYGLSQSTRTLRRVSANLAASVRSLRMFSFLQLLLLLGYVVVGVWGILAYKRRQQEQIWTALAKETAHQLATPISSISAWLEVLRGGRREELLEEMEQDLTRMREVLDRFSRIGMPPKLTVQRAAGLVERSVRFIERRSADSIRFSVEVMADPPVLLDEVLFAWMLENLLRNGVDAIGAGAGRVDVRLATSPDGRTLEIEVADTGEGVRVDKVFEPGVSTKKHGWGLGLTLARRIVESYHRGRLVLKESRPGRTVFAILLPVWREGGER